MGLFDSIAGAMLGKLSGEQSGMAQIAMELLNQNGGMSGILEKFRANDLGYAVDSWVGKGANLPITSVDVVNVLGSQDIAQLATKFGFTPQMLSSKIAEYLPMLIDQLTPKGEVSGETSNLLSTMLGMMK
jgi:uncharacterized protein YidB (DUF937 family)